jgi:anti-sigma B factor antagonist
VEAMFSELGGTLVVMPRGYLDTSNAPEIEKAVLERIEAGSSRIVFDFQRTEYVSSAGLRAVLKAAKLAKKSGGNLCICQANDQILEVLEVSGFLRIISHSATLDDAIQKV